MKTATQILSDEHRHILKVAEALQKECNELKSGKKLDREFFSKAIDFIRCYADRFHHAKEEDILFKELCKPDVEMHCNPVEQMLSEHETGRGFVKKMEEGVKTNNKQKILEGSQGYAGLIEEHIFKEDNILYPMAEEALKQGTKKSMLIRFREAEEKRFPVGAKERYIRIAEEFGKQ